MRAEPGRDSARRARSPAATRAPSRGRARSRTSPRTSSCRRGASSRGGGRTARARAPRRRPRASPGRSRGSRRPPRGAPRSSRRPRAARTPRRGRPRSTRACGSRRGPGSRRGRARRARRRRRRARLEVAHRARRRDDRAVLAEDVRVLDTSTSPSACPRSGACRPGGRRELREVADEQAGGLAALARVVTRRPEAASAARARALGGVERLVVARVGVAHHARARIGREHALEPLGRLVGAVGDDDHARVDRVADPDAAAVVDADPRRARRHVERARSGSASRRSRRSRRASPRSRGTARRPSPESRWSRPITTGAFTAPAADELVDREPRLRAVAVAEPADPRGQALERDPLGRKLEPALEERVVREELAQDLRRSPRCRPGRRRARPTGTARCRGRRAAGYRPGRSPGMRRRPLRPPLRPHLAGCCHNRKHSCRPGRTRACPRRGARSTHGRAGGTRPGSDARSAAASSTSSPLGT